MAKLVIAGRSDCPYYARAELLGDRLQTNLPHFKLHKIVKTQTEWEDWLSETCQTRGWSHSKSPLIWRELVDRGGKGVLIGGANEFQEYAMGYYGQSSDLTSDDMRKVAVENCDIKTAVDEEEKVFRSKSNPLHVCISKAASNISYGMINSIAQGEVFGMDTEISLCLLDTDSQEDYLQGVCMEATDLAQGLLRETIVTSNLHQAFSDCSVILVLDEVSQDPEEEKSAWLQRNADHFSHMAKVINEVAKPDVKVMLAGDGPINFNTFIMSQNAPDVPRENFVGLSRMVENYAKAILASRLKVNSVDVVDVIIWGNTNSVNFIDLSQTRVHNYDGAVWGPPSFSLSANEMLHDSKWVETEFPDLVRQRKETVEENLGHLATMSRAAAVTTMVQHWWNGSPAGQVFSLAVVSEGLHGVPEGLVFSYPVTLTSKGQWAVVQDIDLTDPMKGSIKKCVEDLESEKHVIYPPPKGPSPPPQTEGEASTEGQSEQTQDNVEKPTEVEGSKEVEQTVTEQDDKPVDVEEKKSTEQSGQTDGLTDTPTQ